MSRVVHYTYDDWGSVYLDGDIFASGDAWGCGTAYVLRDILYAIGISYEDIDLMEESWPDDFKDQVASGHFIDLEAIEEALYQEISRAQKDEDA